MPLPSPEFWWAETDPDWFTLQRGNEFTGISIHASETGDFRVVAGSYAIVDVPTERQAQAVSHQIAWTFKDSLPVLDRHPVKGEPRP